ncbi:MAG: dissimilatory-type sulfite reductase subunit alpha [Candidatus Thiodiazotropha endolucinida]|nr:dissimilatory-type sulfite reductase subunit alpha [Candidatus Thiodiazotropha taylori]MCW4249169.1 dissimilatory-type sulfite reductase subunit alpha [Candidatus Thiodiazotropha endolucinida]MCG7882556.1 dissimilatory-type sulfite reductase subunit alpha [Candidatus Thiodiazotropha taylori]MCG7888986.1 dissimilatory-type sulfite reductase subunit alpha [Candidatus Thiodiazotropha taylori]MCG8078040.1 dissimilatory-type sulfite reductase subunit alpha [Candidatus Thiodiazotropha taylori]
MKKHQTPMLDQLESGEWPSFITGIKRLRDHHSDPRIREATNDLLGQLEHSYETIKGYWKGGTVSVFGYGGGIIPRFSEIGHLFPKSKEFHTLRVQPPAGNYYTTDCLRQLANSWEKWGSGLVTFHGQTGNIMFIGATTENTQRFFDEINDYGFDLGGAGPCVRTAQSCVGSGRCEQSCTNEHDIHRSLVNNFLDEMHRPALPYKFKFKVSGCPNDCMNAIERADFAVIGTWRDEMQVDQQMVREYVADKGRKYLVDNVITRCPTRALSLNDDDTLSVDNRNCVRCMHCLNVMPKALSPGNDRGISVLIGGKRTLKIGDRFGTVIVPFMKVETEADYERLVELAEEVIDFFAENALEHERIGEMIERIGLANFLDALNIEMDPNMIVHPRENSYVRTDNWEQEAAKWIERKNSSDANAA